MRKIAIGIDAGTEYTKVVALNSDGSYAVAVNENGLLSETEMAVKTITEVLEKIGAEWNEISAVVKTGISREYLKIAGFCYPEAVCLGEGIQYLRPNTKYVMDTGMRKFLAVRCEDGKLIQYATGEKCASGAGAYLNMVSSFLRIDMKTMNDLYFQAEGSVVLETKCAVFAESEIISMVHNRIPAAEIVKGAFQGLAKRSQAPLINIGTKEELVVTGGVIRIPAYLDALKNTSPVSIITIPEGQIVLAMGAAILAQRECMREE